MLLSTHHCEMGQGTYQACHWSQCVWRWLLVGKARGRGCMKWWRSSVSWKTSSSFGDAMQRLWSHHHCCSTTHTCPLLRHMCSSIPGRISFTIDWFFHIVQILGQNLFKFSRHCDTNVSFLVGKESPWHRDDVMLRHHNCFCGERILSICNSKGLCQSFTFIGPISV
jgi:hypothetical protein